MDNDYKNRLTRIFSIACTVMESEEAARNWLHRAQIGLGGKIPMDLLYTDAGAKEVEELLLRIEHGIIS